MYVPIERFLAILHPACPAKVDALALDRRRTEHGMLPVGLKIHCLRNSVYFNHLVFELGGFEILTNNFYRQENASLCLVLPPVGSARLAVLLVECLEHFIGIKLFNNPDIQIQVCSPKRLSPQNTGLLTLGFYLGSDSLRSYDLDALKTTFSENQYLPRGRRIAIYDGTGALDRKFIWWARKSTGRVVCERLPIKSGRTDVLTAESRVDIQNINLLATLLVHNELYGWWSKLGVDFATKMRVLLSDHQLSGVLDAPWVRTDDSQEGDDEAFFASLQEVMAYARGEHDRVKKDSHAFWRKRREPSGILYEMKRLLDLYRQKLVAESRNLDMKTGEPS